MKALLAEARDNPQQVYGAVVFYGITHPPSIVSTWPVI
jgi:hypothetical protein